MSQTRNDLRTAVSTRLTNLGHVFTPDEIEALLNDIENVIVTDQATAVADCITDLGLWPVDPPSGG